MIMEGIKNWLAGCPYVHVVDMSQVMRGYDGLYKTAGITVRQMIDGTEIHVESWYILVQRAAQLKKERASNEQAMEDFERWVYEQNLQGHFPEIGYTVSEVSIATGYFLASVEDGEAIYQATLQIEFMKE